MVPISGMDLFADFLPECIFIDPLPDDPLPLLSQWLEDARRAEMQPNPDAMTLATVDRDGAPDSRVVLCKGLDVSQGYLVFYTNYDSRKAGDLDAHPIAAATFHWDHAGRQARIRGPVVRSPESESDEYFAMRPILAQLGAWASRQSRPLATRDDLIAQVAETMLRFGIDIDQLLRDGGGSGSPIPRPPNWGGYRLWIRTLELWSGGAGRLHERVRWERQLSPASGGFTADGWSVSRLQP